MTTILCTMLGGPSNGPSTGMASRAVAGRFRAYGVRCVSPAIPAAGSVVAWRKTTAAGLEATHHADATFATPVGSGGSG
jgi:hypothetical protein